MITPNDSDITLPINAITKDGVKYFFLPSGTQNKNMEFSEGDDASNYEITTDENIGSLHFFSDDPVEKGMDYINGSADHSTKAPGRVVLLDENLNVEYMGDVDAIKGRGNSTWNRAQKKPYQIKLAEKANLLDPDDDSQDAKKWILLANAFDNTLLRNQIALNMAKEIGLESTPEGRQVDLYYDGKYLGVYYLCEKVEIGNGRVEINDLEKNSEVLTGGYLFEIDNAYYENESSYFSVNSVGNIVYKSPEMPSEEQAQYVEEIVNEAFACIANKGITKDGSKTLFDCIDKDAAAKYILVEEWIRNIDGYSTSAYFYKPENSEKLFFGPVWDCDLSMGKGGDSGKYDEWFIGGLGTNLCKSKEFRQALREEYTSNMQNLIFDTLLGDDDKRHLKSFENMADEIETAALMNQEVWCIYSGSIDNSDCVKSTQVLREWITRRANWFNQKIIDESFLNWAYMGNEATSGKTENGTQSINKPGQNDAARNNIAQKTVKTKKTIIAKVSRVKVRAKKKKLVVTWGKVKTAAGYEIRYYRPGKFDTSVKVKRIKGSKVTIKKLKKKTKYVVQVRAYSKQGTKLQYGNWSNKITKRTR